MAASSPTPGVKGAAAMRHFISVIGLTAFLAGGAAWAQSSDDEDDDGSGTWIGEPFNPDPSLVTTGTGDEYGVHEKHIERLTQAQKLAPVGVDGFGDQISYFSGGLTFSNADISLPGNSSLPVELRRTFAIEDRRELNNGPSPKGHLGGFAEWDLDIPHLSGMFKATVGWQVAGSATNRCSQPAPPADHYPLNSYDYWNGYNLNTPGGGSQPLLMEPSSKLPPLAANSKWITRSLWLISCKGSTANGYPGEAFIATAPDGTRYHFDHVVTRQAPTIKYGGYPAAVPTYDYMVREMVYFLVTRVEDRFGNHVIYAYGGANGDELASITGYDKYGVPDGRQITLNWAGGRIQSATASTGTWTYGYNSLNQLISVTQPDGSQWTYAKSGKLFVRMPQPTEPEDDYIANCPESDPGYSDPIVYSVKHPAGATASFTLGTERHYRSNVPHVCVKPSTTYEFLQIPNYSDSFTLWSKVVSGPGLTPMTWNYDYQGGHGLAFESACAQPGSTLCPDKRTVTILGSGAVNTREEHDYGILYGVNEGQLLARRIGPASGPALQTTTNTYISDTEAANEPFPDQIGLNPMQYADQLSSKMRPLKSRSILQQGVNFTRTTTAYDRYGNSESDTTVGTATRVEETRYFNDESNWIIGLPRLRLIDGVEVEKVVYGPNALPSQRYNHGLLTQTLGYDAYGNLTSASSASDGVTNTTTLGNWKHGIPQSIQLPTGHTIGVGVNNKGWVTSVTDEVGGTTSYGYDLMGRVAAVNYPVDAVNSWHPTYIQFSRVNATLYGLSPGHWRRITTRGSYRQETYFDGLWRPVFEFEQDTAFSSTKRFKGWKYDHAGRTTFEGYPRASATSVASFGSSGITSQYDSLGRPVSISRATELGSANTDYAYLNDFITRVSNPRGYVTEIAYQAFGEPTTGAPILTLAAVGTAEQQDTDIQRDIFGKPTALTRSGMFQGQTLSATRRYYYDQYARLCKSVEPETGATIVDYDVAGNISWTATSATLLGSACDRASVSSSDKTVRTYDARNRVLRVNYPVGTSDIENSYTPDGKISTTSTNGSVLSYQYNSLRQVTQEQLAHPNGSWLIGHAYDGHGTRASTTYPDGHQVSFAPNALGQATQAGSYATGVTYHPNGAIKQFVYGNNIVHTTTLNARQAPSRSTDALAGNAVLDDLYTYDKNGNVLKIDDYTLSISDRRTMAYDGLDRLLSVSTGSAYGGNHNYTYDPLDNIRSVNRNGSASNYSYDDAGPTATWRLTSVSAGSGALTHSITYDTNGNMTRRNVGDTFQFDRANRMTSASLGGSSYQYDGFGRRYKQTTSAGAEYTFYSQDGQVLFGDSRANQRYFNYIYLGGSLVAKKTVPDAATAQVFYQHTDALGSPIAITGEDGAVLRRERLTAYGDVVDGTWKDGHGFTGHQMDRSTELVYMQQRYYDPTVGRFLSADPMSSNVQNGWNFNRYNYAAGNPFKLTDPDGRVVQDALQNYRHDGSWRMPSENACGVGVPLCLNADGSQSASSENGNGTLAEQLDEAASGLKGVGQGVGSYFKGVLWDLPKHALSTYGLLGEDAAVRSSVAERNVSDTIAFVATEPGKAWRFARTGWDSLSRNQQANLEGRLLGRLATGYVITAFTGVGFVTAPAAAAGNALSAGAELDEGEIMRVMVYGVPY